MKGLFYLVVCCFAVLSSCRQHYPRVYQRFEEKTMAMPLHNVGDSAELKHQMRLNGWDISVAGLTEGTMVNNGEAVRFNNAQARYTMDWKVEYAGQRHGYHNRIVYTSIVVVENRTGKEVLNYSGRFNFSRTVTKRLMRALENKPQEDNSSQHQQELQGIPPRANGALVPPVPSA